MTAEVNKLVMGRFTQFINTASGKLAEELISPNAIFHVPGLPEPVKGPAGYLAIIGMMRGGFPDIQWTLEEMVAEGAWWLRASRCEERTKVHSSIYRRPERQSQYRQ